MRTCVRCGETWRVPGKLARVKRASRWQRGGLSGDMRVYNGTAPLFNEVLRQAIENTHTRNRAADVADHAATAFEHCPNCGSTAWAEQRARRR